VAVGDDSISMLVRFSRTAASATRPGDIMPALAEVAVDDLGFEAAAVFQIEGEAARLVASRNLVGPMTEFVADADALDSELGRRFIAASEGRFSDTLMLPLVSGHDLFGVLVLLGSGPLARDAHRLELAASIADLAATSIARAAAYAELAHSYAELRASRDALARTEKLRALGQMAAGVAHDLKNILNPLGLQLAVLERRIDTDREAARGSLGSMKEVLRVGVETINRLTSFSRQAPEREHETVDLVAIVRTATGLGKARLGQSQGIELIESLEPTPPIRARASELVNAIVNLILNATEAMVESGGTITVTTGESEQGGFVEVADSGPGMPPEIESRVFEPFFTTKREGTGLGLAMVYAFVQRQGGRMTLETAPGKGARFRLWFAAIQATARPATTTVPTKLTP